MNQVAVISSSEEQLKRVLKKIIYGFLFIDVPAEIKATLLGVKKTGKLIRSTFGSVKRFVRSNEKKSNIMSSITVAKATTQKMKSACRAFSNQLQFDYAMMTIVQRRTYIARIAMYLGSFAAGAYIGDGLPDKDIKILGIGAHRNFAFHSVLAAIFGRLIIRFLRRFADCMSEEGFLNEQDAAVIQHCLLAAQGGVSVGVAAHLAIDGTIQGSKAVLFGDWGSLVNGTLLDDKAWLLVNAFAAFFMQTESQESEQASA